MMLGRQERMNPLRFLCCFALAPLAGAQSLEVYSEFRRINSEGVLAAPDRGGRPREILSPAVARNAFSSFHVVVSMPPNVPFMLHIGQNPENSVRVDLYRELYVKRGAEWIPDGLEAVQLPLRGIVPADCKSVAFWMDVWTSDRGPARRIKLELQLSFGDRWIIYPMEVRIKHARVPAVGYPRGTRARVAEPADAAAHAPLLTYLCGVKEIPAEGPGTVRRMIARNARQDMALARALEEKLGREKITGVMLSALGASDLGAWCAAPTFPAGSGTEWYLKIRDLLFRAEDP